MRALFMAALLAALAGCSQTASIEGAGAKILKPNAGTRSYIIKNDREFAESVAAHNLWCRKVKACVKD